MKIWFLLCLFIPYPPLSFSLQQNNNPLNVLRRLFHDIATLAFNDSTFLFSFSVKHIQRNKFIAKIEVFKIHVLLSTEVHMMCVCVLVWVCVVGWVCMYHRMGQRSEDNLSWQPLNSTLLGCGAGLLFASLYIRLIQVLGDSNVFASHLGVVHFHKESPHLYLGQAIQT